MDSVADTLMKLYGLDRENTDSRSFYYLHLPKTAGLTFRRILEDYFGKDEVYPATFRHELPLYPIQNIRDYRLYYGHLDYAFCEGRLADLRVFTILRHPVQRVLSWYFHVVREDIREAQRRGNIEDAIRIEVVKPLGLLNTITSTHPLVSSQIRNGQARRLNSNSLDLVIDEMSDDEMFERARDHVDKLEFVG